ncbi:hypothetical protein HRJ34_09355 [Rhizorhabdus wittichii]|uniref:Uncharacterized protein n=1 Tax=Rhizorhabdus wittichii TaxID=160791 RepID=A0A975HH81_9SPHN|nr:hypothetical protein [Rhizorhabdus wittichii]QTH23684.1 hypothetical protein HRJ34_09355 [Rhizorhabdus wittichii]
MALLSIVAFWLVYFAIATIRSYMIDFGHQTEMMAARAFVTIGSMIATYIVYLAMRPLTGKSLAVNVTAVALLAAPAAIAYSSMNWIAFRQFDKQVEAEKARETASRKIVIDDRSVAAAREQAQVAIAAARDAIREATEQAKAAAEAKAAAQREAAEREAEVRSEIERAQREASQNVRDATQEAEQARREAQREADRARRDAYRSQREAYVEAMADYKEGLREARQAVEEARRHGVNIDIDSILATSRACRRRRRPCAATPSASAAEGAAIAAGPAPRAGQDRDPQADHHPDPGDQRADPRHGDDPGRPTDRAL